MTPKEKAEDLVGKFKIPLILSDTDAGEEIICTTISKQCALIAVEEVRFFHESLFYAAENSLFDDYLNKVKQEIEKL